MTSSARSTTSAEPRSRARRTSPAVIAEVQAAFGHLQGRHVARQLGLVAIGAKPASWQPLKIGLDGGRLFGSFAGSFISSWDARPLLSAIEDDGIFVLETTSDRADYVNIACSPSAARARRLHENTDAMDMSADPGLLRHRNLRFGAMLGYPASGTLAWLAGTAPRKDRVEGFSAEDRPFLDCMIAGDPVGLAEGLAHVRRMADAFRAAFGDLYASPITCRCKDGPT